MRVHVYSKKVFDKLMKDNGINDENVEKFDNIIFISIVDTDQFSYSREPYFKNDHKNVINLEFDDVERDGEVSETQEYKTKAFSVPQAKRLFNFIKENRDKEIAIVHCMAGISRSGAVGTFINGYTQGDWERFKRENSQIVINPRVYRMLNEAKYGDYDK